MRKVQLFFPALMSASALATSLIVGTDAWLQDRSDRALAMELSRQAVAQVEGLSLSVRAEGRKQSLEWAVSQLTQGPTDRRIRISRFHDATGAIAAQGEKIQFNREKRIFTYTKLLSISEAQGVRVEIALPFRGFLGTEHRATRDAAVLLLFGWCFILGWALVRIKIKEQVLPSPTFSGFSKVFKTTPSSAVAAPLPIEPVRLKTSRELEWLPKIRTSLKEIGLKFRDTFLQTKDLAVAAAKASKHVKALHQKIHAVLTSLRNLNEGRTSTDELYTRSLDIIENMRKVIDQPRLLELSHILIQLKRDNEKTRQMLAQVERDVEPWVAEIDFAKNALSEVDAIAVTLDRLIPEAKTALMNQAKIVQEAAEPIPAPKKAA